MLIRYTTCAPGNTKCMGLGASVEKELWVCRGTLWVFRGTWECGEGLVGVEKNL